MAAEDALLLPEILNELIVADNPLEIIMQRTSFAIAKVNNNQDSGVFSRQIPVETIPPQPKPISKFTVTLDNLAEQKARLFGKSVPQRSQNNANPAPDPHHNNCK